MTVQSKAALPARAAASLVVPSSDSSACATPRTRWVDREPARRRPEIRSLAGPPRRVSTGAGWSGALYSRRRPVSRVGAAGRRCGGRLDGRRVVAALGAARRPSRARGLWVQAQRPITGEASWEGRHQSNGRKHSSLSPCLDPKIGTAGARGGGTRSPAVPIHNCCRTFHPRDRGTSGKVTGTRRSLTGHWLGTGRRAPPARDRHAPSP